MSLRRSLSPNQKFSIILASIAVSMAAETGGLFVLSHQYPALTEAPPVPPSGNSTALATKPTDIPLFIAPGAQPPAKPPGGSFVAPPAPESGPGDGAPEGLSGGNRTPSFIAPSPEAGGKNNLADKPSAKESPEKAKARLAFQSGVDALNRKDTKTAVAAFERVVTLVPDNLPSHLNLATIYMAANQPKLALPHLEKAAQIDPKSAAVRFNLGRTLLALRRPKDALVELRQTVHLAPNERDGRIVLAQVLMQMRQPKDAYEQWKYLAEKDNRDIEACVTAAAIANDALHQPKTAEEWLRRSMHATPRAPQPALILGRLLLEQRKFKDAESVLTAATKARPDVFELYPLLANARSATGNLKGAIDAIQSAIMRLPAGKTQDQKTRIAFAEGGLRITLGQILGDAKKPKEARDEFQKAAKLRPMDPQPRSLAAIASLQLKDENEATRQLQAALRLDPKRLPDRKMLAQLYIDNKRWKDADTQLALYAHSRPHEVETLLLWAQVARAAKNSRREKEVVTQITRAAPANPLGWAQLGLLQRESGDKKAALATFTKLAALTPKDPSPPFEMARLQSELGKFDASFQSWQKVVRNKPEYAPSYSSLLQAGDEAKESGAARAFLVRQLSGHDENVTAIKEILSFYDAKKRTDEAKAFLSDLVARNPKFTAAKAALDSYQPTKSEATEPTKGDTPQDTPKPE